jgi:peptidoglycan/xylan/chitin deacetylase (PgdA/CDA1 family)
VRGKRLPPLALAYHGVGDVPLRRPGARLFVRPADLVWQISTLRRWGYRLTTLSTLAARVRNGEGAATAALTFDDGLVDNATVLLPLLRELDVPATVFVAPAWLGEPHPDARWTRIVTAEELRMLSDEGCEVGGHGMNHVDLSVLPYEAAVKELRESRVALEQLLAVEVSVAAYPYGRAVPQTLEACHAAGFQAACRASGEGSWFDPWNLPRQDVDNRCSRIGLLLKRDDRYEPLMRWRPARAARRVSRAVRSMFV